MVVEDPEGCVFQASMSAALLKCKESSDATRYEDLYTALAQIEKHAFVSDASNSSLKQIADTRFIAGIMRHSARRSKAASLLSITRVIGTRRRGSTI